MVGDRSNLLGFGNDLNFDILNKLLPSWRLFFNHHHGDLTDKYFPVACRDITDSRFLWRSKKYIFYDIGSTLEHRSPLRLTMPYEGCDWIERQFSAKHPFQSCRHLQTEQLFA